MKKLLLTFPILCLCLVACSSSNYHDKPPANPKDLPPPTSLLAPKGSPTQITGQASHQSEPIVQFDPHQTHQDQ